MNGISSVATQRLPTQGIESHALLQLPEGAFVRLVNSAFKHYHSGLALSRSALANSPVVEAALVLDTVSPTAEERGRALRLVLLWAVKRLAPGPVTYEVGSYRQFDDPTWRDPLWWRYNILRHRYVDPLHPDDFVDGGRYTETLIALTGIPSADTFFAERHRAIREVAHQLRGLFNAEGEADALRELALAEIYTPLRSLPVAQALLGIAATFDEVFPRALLLMMAADEQLSGVEAALNYLIAQRFLLTGNDGSEFWISPVLQSYVYQQQQGARRKRRHQQVGRFFAANGDPIGAAQHQQRAECWPEAAAILLHHAPELMDEMQLDELREPLLRFKAGQLSDADWREIQILLCDLGTRLGHHEAALAACRQALKVTSEDHHQARIYRRMGKLYEKHNQLHAIHYYEEAAQRFASHDPELVDLFKDRAWLYIFRQEWACAEQDLTLALSLTEADAWARRADIYDALASLYRRQKCYAEASQEALHALLLREKSGDLLRVAASNNNLGLIYNDMGEYAHAIAAFQEALTVYRQLGNEELIALALLNIGMAYHLSDHRERAVAAYEQSLDLNRRNGTPLGQITVLYNLAEALAELERGTEARRYWQQGYDLSLNAGFQDEVDDFLALQMRLPLLQTIPVPATEGRTMPAPAHRSPDEGAVLELVRRLGQITPRDLMDATPMSKSTATRRLADLLAQGELSRHGQGRGTYYTLAERAAVAADRAVQERLAGAAERLRERYTVEQIQQGSPISERLALTVKFRVLPDLVHFFELEAHLSVLLNQPVDLKPMFHSPLG